MVLDLGTQLEEPSLTHLDVGGGYWKDTLGMSKPLLTTYLETQHTPRSYVMTPAEVSTLATCDKRGPNYWLEQRQNDTEAFAERWDRIGSGLT